MPNPSPMPCAMIAGDDGHPAPLTLTMHCVQGGCSDYTADMAWDATNDQWVEQYTPSNIVVFWNDTSGYTFGNKNGPYGFTAVPLTYVCSPNLKGTLTNWGPDGNGCYWDVTVEQQGGGAS